MFLSFNLMLNSGKKSFQNSQGKTDIQQSNAVTTLWRRSKTTFTTYSCRLRGTLSQPSEQCCHNVIDDVAYYLSTTFGQLFFSFHGIEFVQFCAKLKVARHFSGYISHKITFKKNVLGFIFGPIFFKLLLLLFSNIYC